MVIMKSGFLFVILLGFLTGCDPGSKNKSFRLEVNALSFTTDFPSYNLNYFTDSQQKEFVSFADFVTSKKISFHSLDHAEKWSVSLDSLMNKEKERFIYYYVISPDSILLLTKQTNQFFLINRKAEVIRKIDFSKSQIQGIEFVPPIYFESNRICFAVNHYPVEKLNEAKEIGEWNALAMKLPQIGKLNPEKNPERVIYFGKNLVNRFLKPNNLDAQGTYFVINKEQVYYFSPYSDTLYLIHENKIEPLVKITSPLGKIHLTPSTREQYNQNAECINNAYIQQSFICEVLFDNKRELIYIFIRKSKTGKYFPFNILVYNQNLKKLNETAFDGMKYYPNGFVGEKGLYLLRNYSKHPKQKTFDLLDYEN